MDPNAPPTTSADGRNVDASKYWCPPFEPETTKPACCRAAIIFIRVTWGSRVTGMISSTVSCGSASEAGTGHQTSIHSSIASRALRRASSRVSPSLTSPGKAKQRTVYPPSGSGWNVQTYCAVSVLIVSSLLFIRPYLTIVGLLSHLPGTSRCQWKLAVP